MDAWGIDREYEDAFRIKRQAPQATIDAIRRAMGASDGNEPPASRSLAIRRGAARAVGAGVVELEDGSSLAIENSLPPDLPPGYHHFRPRDRDAIRGTKKLLVVFAATERMVRTGTAGSRNAGLLCATFGQLQWSLRIKKHFAPALRELAVAFPAA